jgi:hypothetical protein
MLLRSSKVRDPVHKLHHWTLSWASLIQSTYIIIPPSTFRSANLSLTRWFFDENFVSFLISPHARYTSHWLVSIFFLICYSSIIVSFDGIVCATVSVVKQTIYRVIQNPLRTRNKCRKWEVVQMSLCPHTPKVTHVTCVSRDCMTLITTFLELVVPCCNRNFTTRNIFVFVQVHRNFWMTLYNGTRKFITVFTRARYFTLSRDSWKQWYLLYLRFISILSSHLCLSHPSGLFPLRFPTEMYASPTCLQYALSTVSFIWSPG